MVRIAIGNLQTLVGKRESARHSSGARREKSMSSKRALLVVFCFVVFPICPLLYGQSNGSFSGTVTDKTGSVISGPRYELRCKPPAQPASRRRTIQDTTSCLCCPSGIIRFGRNSRVFNPPKRKMFG